jgi:hypothetical protein
VTFATSGVTSGRSIVVTSLAVRGRLFFGGLPAVAATVAPALTACSWSVAPPAPATGAPMC